MTRNASKWLEMVFLCCSQDIELWKLVELILFNRLYWYKLWYNWNKFAPDGESLLTHSSWPACLQCLVHMHTKSATLFIPRQKQTLCIVWSECTEHEPYYVCDAVYKTYEVHRF